MFRTDIVADLRLHPQSQHQFPHEAKERRIDRGWMAERESAGDMYWRVHQFKLDDMLPVIKKKVRRSLHGERLRVRLDVTHFPNSLVGLAEPDRPAAKLDAKRLESHTSIALVERRRGCVTFPVPPTV
jgi:hypothetical protein